MYLSKGTQAIYRTEWRPILILIEKGIGASGKEYDLSEKNFRFSYQGNPRRGA